MHMDGRFEAAIGGPDPFDDRFSWREEGKDIGDVIHISDVPLPKGAKPTIDRDFVIANISAPRGLRAGDAEDEGEEEASEE